MKITIIVAFAHDRIIGKDGKIPWHMPADLRRFAQLTKGHPVIMGRKTYESIVARNGGPLPERRNIVLTRQYAFTAFGCVVVNSWDIALAACLRRQAAHSADEAFVIGGQSVYELALPYAKKIHITKIDAIVDGDARFPAIETSDWAQTFVKHYTDAEHPYSYCFTTYEKLNV